MTNTPDPATALLVFLAVVVVGVLLLWPGHGVVAHLRRLGRVSERVRLEDVLKQLYTLEYERTPATAESVAGGVQISRHRAIRLLQLLEERHLVIAREAHVRLTDAGRAQALRIVRTHRLWERFLADRTGTAPEDWHDQAEEREHDLSVRETEDLASALGHPVYDPHGDPIPTATGEVPKRSGIPLSSLEAGQRAIITHLEDEPPEIYRDLVALGVGLMAPVERLAAPAGFVHFRSGDRDFAIPGALARNVTVDPTVAVEDPRWSRTLADLRVGDAATVAGLSPGCQGPPRRRLLDLGVVPGTVIRARMRSAGGDPVAYDIRGALIALRREQAALIHVRDGPSTPAAS